MDASRRPFKGARQLDRPKNMQSTAERARPVERHLRVQRSVPGQIGCNAAVVNDSEIGTFEGPIFFRTKK